MKIENNISSFIRDIESAMESAKQEIGITILAEMQSVTPVLSGELKASLSFIKGKVGNKHFIRWGSPLIYAKKVEFENTPYIRGTLRRCSGDMQSILAKHFKKVGK